MKKTFNIFLTMVMVAVIAASFTGCGGGEEDPVPPNVTVAQDLNDAWREDTVSFTITMSTNEKLAELAISSDFTSQNETITDFTGTNSASHEYKFVIPGTVSDGDYITITFKVTDNKGEFTTKTATINVVQPGPDYTPFANEVTTGVFYHISGLLHGAYDLDGDATVGSSGAATLKSMINSDGAGVTFTGSWTSVNGNGTDYVKVTGTTYADIHQENAVTLFDAGSYGQSVTNPQAGDVYIGKKGTSYYVISITTVEPTFSTGTGANTGRITFKYKK